MIAPARMSSSIRPRPERNSADEEAGEHEPVRAAGRRDEDQRRGEEEAADQERGTDPEASRHASRDDRPEQGPDGRAAEHEPERRGTDAQRSRRVEQEEGEEDEVEEVERRDAEQLGADDGVGADPPRAGEDAAGLLHVGRRVRRVDPGEEQRRPEVRHRVDRERVRPLEELDEHATDARAGEERERAAAVRQ
jgi:hypothetical protein